MDLDKKYFDKWLNYSLYLLSIKMRSEKEILDKLNGKLVEPQVIVHIISFLKENGFINDADFAYHQIQNSQEKYGSYRIHSKLKLKGISQSDISDAYLRLEDEDEIVKPEDAAKEVLKKKIASTSIEWERLKTDYKYKYKTYQKLASFLANRGFSGSIIKSTVSQLLAEEFFDEY